MSGIFTIPADLCFVTTLAQGLWQRADGDPMALAATVIYLPTRRAARHLREAFLRVTGGKAALLPRMRPLGDVDEDELDFAQSEIDQDLPPAISPLRRQMLLMTCIRAKDPALPLEQATSLAAALAALLDQAQTEGRDLQDLEKLVPSEYAGHWQETLAFLSILLQEWPRILESEGAMDPAARRNLVLQRQAQQWLDAPPAFPVLAAGSTGSHPAVGRLMAVIASLPQGEVILPALDLSLDETSWQAVTESHPQYTMSAWLDSAKLKRRDVRLWDDCAKPSLPRLRLIQESMRPAEVTEKWRELNTEILPPESFQNLEALTLDHHREEADVIALRLRAALEVDGQTAALVTPDRALAARVAASLGRWGITANDSAGSPLNLWSVGRFQGDVLAAAEPETSPIAYLSLLKHPLAAAGCVPSQCRHFAREAEVHLWRGVRRSHGWAGAAKAALPKHPDLAAWLAGLARVFAPWTEAWRETKSMAAWIDTHMALAETLAATADETGAARLWRGEAGEAAVLWLDEWRSASAGLPPITAAEYQSLFAALCHQVQVRPRYGAHPRLSLLGPLEARLIHHDLVILGGLNEETWPPAPPIDPWLSRPMKRAFGLPTPERRIGLSAHDFAQLASGPQVVLTRARRVGGSPSVPSRFWLQLEAVLQAAGHDPQNALASRLPWRAWARQMDVPAAVAPVLPPEPTPALTARPRQLSVTEIGTWRRNPYAIYAKHILKLRKLEDIDADVSAADFGTVVHAAFEAFVRETMTAWPNAPESLLRDKGRAAFAPYADRPQVMAFWWPRFERLAAWFIALERERRAKGIRPVSVEGDGKMPLLDGAFTLTGRADRIDQMADGRLAIIDYKTGAVPSKEELAAGYEPQLALLAMLAECGAITGLPAAEVGEVAYWALGEKDDSKKEKTYRDDLADQIQSARAGLEHLIRSFADPATPYQAEPKPKRTARYNDYAHLARMAEWGRFSKGGKK